MLLLECNFELINQCLSVHFTVYFTPKLIQSVAHTCLYKTESESEFKVKIIAVTRELTGQLELPS